MGSYISIYNNTKDTYLVKVGVDEAALKIAGIVVAVVAAVAAVVSAVASGSGITAKLVANGVMEVFGISTAALASITALASTIAGFTIAADALGFAVSMVTFITDKLQKEEGYVEIKPGHKKSFGKYSLSLWRQGTCQRVRVNPDNKEEVVMDTLYMRPIFSGATAGSTKEHNIQYWIDKWGHEDTTIIRMNKEDRSKLDFDEAKKLAEQNAKVDYVKVVEKLASEKAAQEQSSSI